ncbi:TPA: polysaccharide export protein Wza, partial [Escherichia coli]|nr:polysaccharide export protein Wza [Escherichia coli]
MKRLSVIAIMLTALTGCTVTPGVYMSTSGKNVLDTGDRDISKFVDIYPISPKLLDEMYTPQVIAKPNPT